MGRIEKSDVHRINIYVAAHRNKADNSDYWRVNSLPNSVAELPPT